MPYRGLKAIDADGRQQVRVEVLERMFRSEVYRMKRLMGKGSRYEMAALLARQGWLAQAWTG
jgi:hypothetical protein